MGPAAGFEGLLPARAPALSLLTVPGVLVSDQEKLAGAPENDDPARALRRWENGISWTPEKCIAGADLELSTAAEDFPFWWECTGDGGQTPEDATVSGTKKVGARETTIVARPVQVWAGFACRGQDAERRASLMQERAARSLECVTPRAVEHELWTGQAGLAAGYDNPYLADPDNVDILSAAPLGFVTALAELEDALGECTCAEPAMIHAERRLVTAWASEGLVAPSPDGTHLRTLLGTVVVPGTGYPGTGPSSSQSGEGSYAASYAFGTGRVRVFLGDLQFSDGPGADVDRSVNDWVVRAERSALAVFDRCCNVGIPVLLCDERCGSGS